MDKSGVSRRAGLPGWQNVWMNRKSICKIDHISDNDHHLP